MMKLTFEKSRKLITPRTRNIANLRGGHDTPTPPRPKLSLAWPQLATYLSVLLLQHYNEFPLVVIGGRLSHHATIRTHGLQQMLMMGRR